MTLIYIIVGIAIIHAIFLLYPVYRDEALDVYTWTPWTEKEYALFRKLTGNAMAVKIRLLINWLLWPFLLLFVLVMPIVFLVKLPDILKEYDGEISKLKSEKSSHFTFKTNIKQKPTYKSKIKDMRPLSSSNIKKKWRFSDEPVWKKFLRGKLLYLVKKNIVLCEKKFNPTMFTESISNVRIKEFKNKFRNLDNRNKVGIFTNKFPSILNQGNKFYTRYFDYFISPDELLNQNFTKEEIFQIKADPIYFNFGGNFSNVNFFKKRTLKETLNEEEKIGPTKLLDVAMQKSLKQTKKRIQKYLNYYTSVMSRQGLIG